MKHKQKDKKVPTFKFKLKPKFSRNKRITPGKVHYQWSQGKTKSRKYQETTEAWCPESPTREPTETWWPELRLRLPAHEGLNRDSLSQRLRSYLSFVGACISLCVHSRESECRSILSARSLHQNRRCTGHLPTRGWTMYLFCVIKTFVVGPLFSGCKRTDEMQETGYLQQKQNKQHKNPNNPT